MVIREELVECIYFDGHEWSCPSIENCELVDCRECASNILAEYEQKIRADALKEAFDKTYTKAYDSGYQQGRKDAEVDHEAMCETCIHKVSAEDVLAIMNGAIDEYFSRFDEFVKSNPKLTYFWTEFQVEARRIAERMKEQKQ